MPEPDGATKPLRACYNCRKRRLRCDRSRPGCHKCRTAGEQCLGYGTVLRWANAPAVRGKLVGQLAVTRPATRTTPAWRGDHERPLSIHTAPLDPLLNNLSHKARHYFNHFATAVCRDLVSFDQPHRNPFRTIISLAGSFDYLEAIIVATGAMHLAALHGYPGQPDRSGLVDALAAKGEAIRLLRSAVDNITPATQAMVLAGTVFLINIDLIDSGKGGWQTHIEAASALMSSLHDPAHVPEQSVMQLVDVIAADCLTYRVLGSAIGGVTLSSWAEHGLADFMSVLKRAEAYSYHCCPPEILRILLSASHLCAADDAAGQTKVCEALSLLHQARSFDVHQWLRGITDLAAEDDLEVRESIALAHRATACLYILLAVPEASPVPSSVDPLVQEVLHHLAAVPIDHVHLKGTIWPTFVVGTQTDDPAQRAWCLERMQTVLAWNPWICPWGYVRTAVQMMQSLWEARDREPAGSGKRNWLLELKNMREKCLIV